MRPGRRRHWIVPGVALLACVGVWLGHTLEYVRVWGLSGLGRELTGSVHLYMLPLGLGLTCLLALASVALFEAYRRFGRRMERASRLLAGGWRGATPVPRPAEVAQPARWGARRSMVALGSALACVQIVLYLVQENLESAAAGVRMPGLSAITGIHWAAPLIHLGVAFVLAALAVGVWSLLRRREVAVERFERAIRGVLAALTARRARTVIPVTAPVAHVGCPELLGASIWCRPPPLAPAL